MKKSMAWVKGAFIYALIVISLMVAGCAGSGGSPGDPAHPGAERVDPQAFGDVVEWAMPLPGAESQDRARRIPNFMNNLGYLECGATPAPLDYVDDTAGNQYPDLELIRDRGLAPIYDATKYYKLAHPYGEDQSPECAALMQLCESASSPTSEEGRECIAERKRLHPRSTSPAYLDAMTSAVKVAATWQNDTMLTVANSAAVLEEAKPMAQCLRDGSGLPVTDDNPSDSFLGSVDLAYFEQGSDVSENTMWEWSELYADCGAPYFETVRQELLRQRPDLVERHREALEAFAAQLVALGYVP